jgi:hypothetical protein
MRILYILPFVLLASCFSEEKVDLGTSTTFIRYYNGGFNDEPVTIAKTTDNGYIILSNVELNDGRYKIKLIKTDDQGNEVWTKLYPEFNASKTDPLLSKRAFGLLVLEDGSYVLTGENIILNRSQVLVMTVGTDGNLITEKIYTTTDPSPQSIRGIAIMENTSPTKKDGNGNLIPGYIVLGSVLTDNADNNIVLSEIKQSDLSAMWSRGYGSGESNLTNKIFLDTKGSVFFGGTVTRQNKSDVRLVKTIQDSQNTDFDLPIGSPEFNEVGYDICRYGYGFAVVGRTNEKENAVAGETDILFQRLAEDGSVIGEPITFPIKTAEGIEVPGNKAGNAISVTQDGGLLIAGTVPSNEPLNFGRGEADLYLIKIDAFGTVTWQKDIGSSNPDFSVAVLQADDGGYVVLASTTLVGLKTIMLLKTDVNGDIQ